MSLAARALRRKSVWLAVGLAVLCFGAGFWYAARKVSSEFEPYLREQTIRYLSDHFDAYVELKNLRVRLPTGSRLKLWVTHGRGAVAGVTGEGLVIRRRERPTEPPVLAIRTFSFSMDLGELFSPVKRIASVRVDGMELQVPPKGDRPKFSNGPASGGLDVAIEEMRLTNTKLVIRPRDPSRKPLQFDISQLVLHSEGIRSAMRYEAHLRNPKPPGDIESYGRFGPWEREDPGSSPLEGMYNFRQADLGVFRSIGGTLESTGRFKGELSHLHASGEAYVPKFYLKIGGNPLPLRAAFQVEVDGTNGNTTLQPVHAQLGQSSFSTTGTIFKHDGDTRRSIELGVKMSAGRIEDFLRLAVKGDKPFLTGALRLDTRISIPPMAGKVVDKLNLRGTFELTNGRFQSSAVQNKLDELSRKGQGQPGNEEIDDVVSQMGADFILDDQTITFSRLAFGVPGADIDLAGSYVVGAERLDFKGTMKLKATVSQTQTGIKRWILKPVDPFFSKQGAGTFLRIKIAGTRSSPVFGLDKN